MAEISYEADLLRQVIEDHGHKQEVLALHARVAPHMISRYLSGQYPIPVQVFAAAYRLTSDRRLLRLFGSPSLVVLGVPVTSAPDFHTAFMRAVNAHQSLLTQGASVLAQQSTAGVQGLRDAARQLMSAAAVLEQVATDSLIASGQEAA